VANGFLNLIIGEGDVEMLEGERPFRVKIL
jgi:hypothetical protein